MLSMDGVMGFLGGCALAGLMEGVLRGRAITKAVARARQQERGRRRGPVILRGGSHDGAVFYGIESSVNELRLNALTIQAEFTRQEHLAPAPAPAYCQRIYRATDKTEPVPVQARVFE